MKTLRTVSGWMLLGGLLLAMAGALAGCDVDSVDSTTAVPSDNSGKIYNYSGLYLPAGTNVDLLVFPTNRQSGVKLTWLRLLQYGTVLEGYDNANKTWTGKISSINEGNASFTLEGTTTAGNHVNVAGSLRYADQNSTMDATWIEPGFSGSIFARAAVSAPSTNTPITSLSISPTSATLSIGNSTRTFTASGGSGNYTWTHSNASCGSLSATTGNSITYTRLAAGTDTLTVSSEGFVATASITCQ
ncbi:MAG TPA: hypothetical protein PLD40_10425 [Kiritimatiellia bacterium]|jgi:hypothetical protein|nr:MAG: hypothetical protein BWX54_01710 [Verrucomicrobia bacterium ADurb.Bin018]HOE01483.1 hypothetical protein [Kiritimatiellia bacterium]HOE37895.1 hypothetical protein [Kiritimatiellia bacterium]HOR75252.1 hypothetical protein [Kiritimatiellia bacterium]HOU59728.1 hypothetical protein [Kiritimatiellia bacterium]